MPNDPNTPGGSFLGGGPKFNQAGQNAPLPGEKVAATVPPAPLGGPRVWAGVAVVIVLIGALWLVYGGGLAGVRQTGGHGSIDASSHPGLDPDHPDSTTSTPGQ